MSGVEAYDEDANDQPVDYSKKYVERNALSQTRLMIESTRTDRPGSSKKVSDAKVDLFYAETDLDQPTDYSLRYAEDDTDDEEKQDAEYFPGVEQEDTIKTYCTEGTPYETPLNFSTATSMSDLRIEDTKKGDLLRKVSKRTIEMNDRSPASFVEQAVALHCDEPDSPVIKEEEELENPKDTVVLNPGQVTPEKIVNYYEEGKSHGLSRANSLSSLNSAVNPQNNVPGVISKTDSPDSTNKEELDNNDYSILRLNNNQVELPSERNSMPVNKSSPRVLDKEGKIVTFGSQGDYAEETPLMFSRCSSLGSLSGFEQHSIHDDHSSVVSDFSRTVSDGDEDDEDMLAACINMGMQTNRYRQSLQALNIQKPIQSEPSNVLGPYQRDTVPSRLELHAPVAPAETSIGTSKTNKTMEIAIAPDTVHVYCTEDTPADISPVGSQSNLSALSMPSVQEDIESVEHDKSTEIDCHRNDLFDDESSNLSGEDEKILDECIQSGMPKARQITPPINSILFVKKPETVSHRFNVYGTPSSSPVETNQTSKNPVFVKSLASASVQHPDELSDDSPNHSDDEAILTECIQSAMPKARFNMTSIRSSLSQSMENPKTLNMRSSSTPSTLFQSGYAEQRKNLTKKFLLSEDNIGLSEEEDIILAQCIKSGMPKVLSSVSSTMAPAIKKIEPNLKTTRNFSIPSFPSYFVNKTYTRNAALHVPSSSKSTNVDITNRFAGNATSGNFNCFSRKTMNNIVQTSGQTLKNYHNNTRERMNNSSYSCTQRSPHHRTENENSNSVDNLCVSLRSRVIKYDAQILNKIENDDDDSQHSRNIVKTNAVPSRHSSVNSLSEEGSLISTEEWALLEFCITSGMPRNKYPVKGIKPNEDVISGGHDDCESIPEDNYSVCSYNSYVCKI